MNPSAKKPIKKNKVIAVTLGDPQGIGPEVIAKSLADYSPGCSLLLVGARRFFPASDIPVIKNIDELQAGESALLDIESGLNGADVSFVWVKTAVEMALRGEVQALVTAPVNKNK
ncbi:MAG: 4-hydroxythreonine-4-phosphate dehydrogenase PdxA [Candidatus Aminicenantes bacterium]|nr:4-hydroxythreonine-4-phosphate dehydrogenase PdxA [Candidatus Aminicenantes bacterium]